jgi:hypothetical protein
MYIVRKYQQQIDRFICSGNRGAFFLAFALLAVALATLGTLFFKFGAPAMNGRPWDMYIILDGAWRIASGQVPHRDYYNYLGDLPFYMTALGMKLSRPCVSAIDYGNVVLMAALALPAMAVLRRRTSALAAFLFSLFIGLLVITPRPLGDPYDYTDHAMLYNRYGEAFIALFGTIVLLPPRPEFGASRANWAEAVLAGFVLVALLGCKLNYFIVGIGFFGVACVTGRIRIGWALLCLCSAAACLAIALALSKIPLPDLVNDYRMMSACQSLGGRMRGMAGRSGAGGSPTAGLAAHPCDCGHLRRRSLAAVVELPVWRNAVAGAGGLVRRGNDSATNERNRRSPIFCHGAPPGGVPAGFAVFASPDCNRFENHSLHDVCGNDEEVGLDRNIAVNTPE